MLVTDRLHWRWSAPSIDNNKLLTCNDTLSAGIYRPSKGNIETPFEYCYVFQYVFTEHLRELHRLLEVDEILPLAQCKKRRIWRETIKAYDMPGKSIIGSVGQIYVFIHTEKALSIVQELTGICHTGTRIVHSWHGIQPRIKRTILCLLIFR